MKAAQDIILALIMGLIMLIVNADSIFAKFRFYKIYFVLRKSLHRDLGSSVALTMGCLIMHRIFPEAKLPGIALHLSSIAVWIFAGVQANPMVSCGLYLGGKNQMTRVQLMLRVAAQTTGMALALAVFGFWSSFRFPGRGPFHHFFGLESAVSAVATLLVCVGHIRVKEAKASTEKRE